MGKKKQKPAAEPGVVVVARNKQARRRWEIEETLEAGLVLTGTEVKSMRGGGVQLADAYAVFDGGELYLVGMHIAHYPAAGPHLQHEPGRRRKLLLRTDQLKKLQGKLAIRGYSLIPLDVHFRNGWAKVEVGLARGKKTTDRRDDIKKREADLEVARALRRGKR